MSRLLLLAATSLRAVVAGSTARALAQLVVVLHLGFGCSMSRAGSGRGGLTSRSSRSRFVAQNTWQVKLAMCFAPLRVSA